MKKLVLVLTLFFIVKLSVTAEIVVIREGKNKNFEELCSFITVSNDYQMIFEEFLDAAENFGVPKNEFHLRDYYHKISCSKAYPSLLHYFIRDADWQSEVTYQMIDYFDAQVKEDNSFDKADFVEILNIKYVYKDEKLSKYSHTILDRIERRITNVNNNILREKSKFEKTGSIDAKLAIGAWESNLNSLIRIRKMIIERGALTFEGLKDPFRMSRYLEENGYVEEMRKESGTNPYDQMLHTFADYPTPSNQALMSSLIISWDKEGPSSVKTLFNKTYQIVKDGKVTRTYTILDKIDNSKIRVGWDLKNGKDYQDDMGSLNFIRNLLVERGALKFEDLPKSQKR